MAKLLPKHHHRAVFYTSVEEDYTKLKDDQGIGYAMCLHKKTNDGSPYLLPNELICARLGQFIGLPVPPFAVTYSVDGQSWFSSLYFNFDREQLPDVLPDKLWETQAAIYSGVIAFDVFIANGDRHDRNLAVDNPLKPKHIQVFDHDQALLATGGIDRLRQCRGLLGLTRETGGSRNDFVWFPDTPQHFQKWAKKIREIPDWFIEDTVRFAKPYGLPQEAADACVSFLKQRKTCVFELIWDNRSTFPSISNWSGCGRIIFQ